MNCRRSRPLFGAYWDDELTQAEREWLESHFATCARCRREYDELARTLEMTASLPRVEVSSDFAERVIAQARRRPPAQDRMSTPAPRWVPVTAGALLVTVLAGMALQWSGLPDAWRRRDAGVVPQPVLLEAVRVTAGEPGAQDPVALLEDPATAIDSVPDSLFDHSEDVEFILDAVTLRKGRAHTVTRIESEPARGAPAVITF